MQRTAEAGSRRSTPRSRPKPTRGALEQGAPERGVDEPRRAPAAWAGHSRSPGRIRKERVRERDRIRGAKSQRGLDEALFRCRMQVDRAWRDVRAASDLAHAQSRVAATRDLAQRR